MLFTLRLQLDHTKDTRLQILDGLTSAMDTVRHEDTFQGPADEVSAMTVDLFGVDSHKIGRMMLIDSPEDEEH